MKYHIRTFGCQMNEADSQRIASEMEKLGIGHTPTWEEADVMVINTCVVRQAAEDAALGYLHKLKPFKQSHPNMVVGVMGCLVGVKGNTPLKRTFPWVDVFMAPSEPGPMIEHLLQRDARKLAAEETAARFRLQDGDYAPLMLPAHEVGTQVMAHVPIVLGCSHACTFCIIPHRRGAERSRPMDEIVHEVQGLVAQGVKEVTLLGQIVDRYGYDLLGDDYAIRSYNPGAASGHPSQTVAIDSPLVKLLARLNDVPGLERIRFLTSHPNWMTDELLDAVRDLPKLMPYIEVPVQAGDDDVLLRMRRGYSRDDFRRLVDRVRARLPNASIATDVIVGFCGETEAQFMNTHDLLEELKLDVIHLARYSTRPNTPAEKKLADDVPEDEKMRRLQFLEAQQERIVGNINAAHMNQTVQVLVEDLHKGKWRGRTPQNKLVFFEDAANWRGKLADVKINWTGPWSLRGELITAS